MHVCPLNMEGPGQISADDRPTPKTITHVSACCYHRPGAPMAGRRGAGGDGGSGDAAAIRRRRRQAAAAAIAARGRPAQRLSRPPGRAGGQAAGLLPQLPLRVLRQAQHAALTPAAAGGGRAGGRRASGVPRRGACASLRDETRQPPCGKFPVRQPGRVAAGDERLGAKRPHSENPSTGVMETNSLRHRSALRQPRYELTAANFLLAPRAGPR